MWVRDWCCPKVQSMDPGGTWTVTARWVQKLQSAKIERKHLVLFREMWQSNFMSVKSNNILCICAIYFIFLVINFIVLCKCQQWTGNLWTVYHRQFEKDSTKEQQCVNLTFPECEAHTVVMCREMLKALGGNIVMPVKLRKNKIK